MPLYVYVCSVCRDYFERNSSLEFSEMLVKLPCCKCGGKVRRSFTAPAVHMRGYSKGDARYNRGMKK